MADVRVSLPKLIEAFVPAFRSLDIRGVVADLDRPQAVLAGVRISSRTIESVERGYERLSGLLGQTTPRRVHVLREALPFAHFGRVIEELSQGMLTIQGISFSIERPFRQDNAEAYVDRYPSLVLPLDERRPGALFTSESRTTLYQNPTLIADVQEATGLGPAELTNAFLEVKDCSRHTVDLFIYAEMPARILALDAVERQVRIDIEADPSLTDLRGFLTLKTPTGEQVKERRTLSLGMRTDQQGVAKFVEEIEWKEASENDLVYCVLSYPGLPQVDAENVRVKRSPETQSTIVMAANVAVPFSAEPREESAKSPDTSTVELDLLRRQLSVLRERAEAIVPEDAEEPGRPGSGVTVVIKRLNGLLKRVRKGLSGDPPAVEAIAGVVDVQEIKERLATAYHKKAKQEVLTGVDQLIVVIESRLAASAGDDNAAKRGGSKAVFIVHGHDEIKEAAARYVERLGLEAVVLHEQPNEGQTVIEKFEKHAGVGFAVVVLTPDDLGGEQSAPFEAMRPRARQNVILEMGYFLGKLGRRRVCALYREGVEIPSDYQGVLYIKLDEAGAWKTAMAREMRAAGLEIHLDQVL